MADEDLERAKREAVEVDRAVRKARYWDRYKRAGLGCLVLVGLAIILALALVGLPGKHEDAGTTPLPAIHGAFIAQELHNGDTPGTVVLDGRSAQHGTDEQVSFMIDRTTGRMRQCEYWSTKALNHLTVEYPPQDVCSFKGAHLAKVGEVEVGFSMIVKSLSSGQARNVSGTLLFSKETAHSFSALLPSK
jgi:hypothetical protein